MGAAGINRHRCGFTRRRCLAWDARSIFTTRDRRLRNLIKWAAHQSWSTGKVGLIGTSYQAIKQWMVAARQPEGLAAILSWDGAFEKFKSDLRRLCSSATTTLSRDLDAAITSLSKEIASYRTELTQQIETSRKDIPKLVWSLRWSIALPIGVTVLLCG